MKRLLLSMLTVAMFSVLIAGGVGALGASPPNHDTFVRVTQPDMNFNAQQLSVAASTTACNPTDITYLRWDLTDIPAAAVVYTASLTLTANYVSNTSGVVLGLYETESGWQEDMLTYQTAPALGMLIETQPAPTASGQTLTFNSAALVAYLNDRLSGNMDSASFALRFSGGCGIFALARFNDRESGALGPDLQLAFDVIAPDLVLSKSGPATAYPGQMITYTLVYTNVGNAPAPYTLITDTLPAALQVYDYTGLVILSRLDDQLVWELVDLLPGASGTLTVTAIVSPTFSGVLTNVATIATTAVESDTTNNVTPPVVTEVRAPDLAIHKSGPAMSYPGEVITYTLVYTNVGNAPAPYVTITDVMPPQTTVFDHTGTVVLPLLDQTLTWEVFNLAPGDSGVLTITAIVNPTFTGLLTNTATMTTTIFESDTTNNVTPPVVTEVRAPDLAIHKSGPVTAYPGDVIEYTLVYTNVGDALAPYVTITDLLPLNVQLYDHSGTVLLPHPAEQLTWEVFNLAPNAGGTLTVSVVISPTFTGWLTNTVMIATTVPEIRMGDNMSAARTLVAHRLIYLPLVMRFSP